MPDLKQILRDAILQVMDANRTTFGLTEAVIIFNLRYFSVTAELYGGEESFKKEIAESVEYLTKKELVKEVESKVNRHIRHWCLTTAGFAYVDQNL